jgi:hypothetical protein
MTLVRALDNQITGILFVIVGSILLKTVTA